MNMKKQILLFLLSVCKILFTILTYPLTFIIMIFEVIIFIISFGYIDFSLTKKFSNWCIYILEIILHNEINLLLNKL